MMSGFVNPNQRQIPLQFNDGINIPTHNHTQSFNIASGVPLMGHTMAPINNIHHQHSHSFSQQPMTLPPPPGFNYTNNVVNKASILNQFRQPQMMLLTPVQDMSNFNTNNMPMKMPVKMDSYYPIFNEEQSIQSQPFAQQQQQTANGGVNSVLDYSLEIMTDYIVEFSLLAFDAKDKFEEANVDDNQESVLALFNKAVCSVLNATRLPSVTIFQGLHFLSKYLSSFPDRHNSIGGNTINIIYQHTMMAFILANKFNDDKTFTNKSWSEATGMQLNIINEYEREWLKAFEWKLFEDRFVLYNDYVEAYKTYVIENTSLPDQQYIQFSSPVGATNSPISIDINPNSASEARTPVFSNSGNLYSSPYFYNKDDEFYYQNNKPSMNNQMNFSNQMPATLPPAMHMQIPNTMPISYDHNANAEFYPSSSPLSNFSPIKQGLFTNFNNGVNNNTFNNTNANNNYNSYGYYNNSTQPINNLQLPQPHVQIMPQSQPQPQTNFYQTWNTDYQYFGKYPSSKSIGFDGKYFNNSAMC